MAIKRALLVGINTYPGAPLRGCVNDILAIEEVLKNNYDFTDITKLTDNAATTDAMRAELDKLVTGLHAGDVVYFHYSGHGSQVYDSKLDNDYEPDGLDEIICPVDLNWKDKMITDDELKTIFDRVPGGVNLTVMLDCCNSGGALDQDNQYQAVVATKSLTQEISDGRYLAPPTSELVPEIEQIIGFKPKELSRNVNTTGLLISGCQSTQTSADAYINGKYMGAATWSLTKNLKANTTIDYKELIDNMNNDMVGVGFTQRPELNGPEELFAMRFLEPVVIGTGLEAPVPPAEILVVADIVVATPTPALDTSKKDNKKLIIGAAIAVALAILIYFVS